MGRLVALFPIYLYSFCHAKRHVRVYPAHVRCEAGRKYGQFTGEVLTC